MGSAILPGVAPAPSLILDEMVLERVAGEPDAAVTPIFAAMFASGDARYAR